MAFAARAIAPDQAEGVDSIFDFADEATTSSREEYLGIFVNGLAPQSTFWERKLKFVEARMSLRSGSPDALWHPYGTEPPNRLARELTAGVLKIMEQLALAPSQLRPSAEGGIGLAFVNKTRRAMIEIYNDGDIVAGTYSNEGTPDTWETNSDEMRDTIERLRVYLTA